MPCVSVRFGDLLRAREPVPGQDPARADVRTARDRILRVTLDDLTAAVDVIAQTLPRPQVEALARALEHHDRPSASVRSTAMSVVPTPAFADLAGKLVERWTADAEGI